MLTNQRKHILLVEDNANDAELTLTLLGDSEPALLVDRVCDGAEALDYLYRRGAYANRSGAHPVAILLDLKMPKVNGLEVLRELKSDEKLKSLPVVILTSSNEVQDLRECYQAGANGYVVKPVDAQQFIQAIKNLGAYWAVTNEPPPF